MQTSSFLMDTLIPGVSLVLFGGAAILFRKKYGVEARRFDLKFRKFPGTEKMYEIVYLIAGIAFLVSGLLTLFGIQ